LIDLSDRVVGTGGELQRFAIAMTCVQQANVYMFDEPSSYLDVKQRLNAARAIRALLLINKCVCVKERDGVFLFILFFVYLFIYSSFFHFFFLRRVHSFVIVVEHDLSVLDYLSDYVCCLYGYCRTRV
jgi:ATP-binding cassette subfamily E protein 1